MEENKTVIDLSQKTLDESWLRMFGTGISAILNAMFSGTSIPVSIKGSQQEIQAFAKTLSREKKYLETYKNLGLDNAETYKNKLNLNKAVKEFTKTTGLPWPFK